MEREVKIIDCPGGDKAAGNKSKLNALLSAAYNLYKPPFRYDWNGQMVFDSANNLVIDVRGWGRIEKMDNGIELQDKVGEIITEALNEKWSKVTRPVDEDGR